MRRVEKPPFIDPKWNYGELLMSLPAPKFFEFIDINDSQYPYWEKWKYLAKDWDFDPRKLWSIVKTHRSPRQINFKGQEGFRMKMATPSIMQQQLHELDMDLGGSLQTNNLIPEDEKKYYLVSTLMEEAIASSQIEGAATTRKLAKEMLESNRKPATTSEQMIANNYEVMQWIIQNKHAVMTAGTILEIHQMITGRTLPNAKDEGAFRQDDDIAIVDVQTGTVIHTPPGHVHLKSLMEEFCDYANDRKKEDFFLHPIAKAISLHFLIGYIHPFADGNGRTARALFYWYLIKKGYWMIEYMSISRIILGSKAQYAKAYQHTELDEMDITYFILYNLKAIQSALTDLKKYIHKKNQEKKNLLGLLRNTDFNERQITVLQEILNDSENVFSVTAMEKKFAVSNQTARNDLNDLVKRGILQTRKNGKQIQFLPVQDAIKKIRSS
jgi:Fic family protein